MSAATIHLPADDVHLWFSFHDELGLAAIPQRYRELLSADELTKASKFFFETDRFQYLLTRTLVRTVLSRYVPLPPSAWRFEANSFGRPSIIAAQLAAMPGLSFNLSHTRGLVILGVTRGARLGVDTENVLRQPRLELAQRMFATDEASALRMLPPAAQPDRFYRLWTLKESYIKARGLGLRFPLERFSFALNREDHISLHIDPSLEGTPQRWMVWQLRPSADHLVAVCVERLQGGGPGRLVCRETMPLDFEREISVPISGCS